MSPAHARPFLVDQHGPSPRIRIIAQSPRGAAREAFARLGDQWPVTVIDRELGEVTEWWTPSAGGRPGPLHYCDCGAPVRQTGRRGRPFETCAACRETAA